MTTGISGMAIDRDSNLGQLVARSWPFSSAFRAPLVTLAPAEQSYKAQNPHRLERNDPGPVSGSQQDHHTALRGKQGPPVPGLR